MFCRVQQILYFADIQEVIIYKRLSSNRIIDKSEVILIFL